MEIREKAFPRGGSKPALKRPKKTSSLSFLGKKTAKVKKKNKKVNNNNNKNKKGDKNKNGVTPGDKPKISKGKSINAKYVEEFNASVAQDGMLVLGMVSEVTDKVIKVSLPGTLRGIVTLPHVSDLYTSMVQGMVPDAEVVDLKELFEPGDVLPVRIAEVSDKDGTLILTCNPKVVNSKLTHDIVEKGLVLSGNVKSREEYGFIIDFGIDNAHGFLHLDKISPGKELKVGQIVRCAVVNCNKSVGSCNVQCSTLPEDVHGSYLSLQSALPLSVFVPGFQFEVCVEKKLVNGVEVSLGKQYSSHGYIHEDQLCKKFPNLSEVEVGSRAVGTLLYVKPLVNIMYFKIMPKKETEWPFNYGDIVGGRVVQTRRNGVMVKVVRGSQRAKCFIPIGKLRNSNKLINDKVPVESLYPVSKKLQRIRLGGTSFMNRYYLGATDKESLEEKYFSVADLKCGEVLTCTISSLTSTGARLKIGRMLTGLVGHVDMTDVPTRNVSSRFKIGQKVKARVLDVLPENKFVRLTMKPSLVKEKKILSDLNFKPGDVFLGVVLVAMSGKLVVKFFNSITGTVPKHLTPYPDAMTLEDHYAKGQLVKCTALGVRNNGQVNLSLLVNSPNVHLKPGTEYQVSVINKTERGLLLEVLVKKDVTCTGYLPKELLTIHQDLAPALLATYAVGEKFKAYCVLESVNHRPPTMGTLEILAEFYGGMGDAAKAGVLAVDSVLPFLFKSRNLRTKRNFFHCLIPGKSDLNVRCVREDVRDDDDGDNEGQTSLVRYQVLYGKVLSVTDERIDISTRVSDVWDKDFHSSLAHLDSYLTTATTLVGRQKASMNAYSDDAALERFVRGTIEEVRTNHAIVKTDDGDLGLVQGKFTKGQEINGTIVWIDGPEQMIHVAAHLDSTYQPPENGELFEPEWTKLHTKVVFFNRDLVVCQLRGKLRGKLAYMPLRRHLNDFEKAECQFNVGDGPLVWLTTKKSKRLLAIDNRLVAQREKAIWKNSNQKLKTSIVSLKRKLESEKLERSEKRRRESESQDLEIVETRIRTGEMDTSVDMEIKQEVDVDDEAFNSTCNSVPYLEYDDIDIKSEADDDVRMKNEMPRYGSRNEEKIPLSSSSDSDSDDDGETNDRNRSGRQDPKSKSDPFKVGFNWEVLNDSALLSGVALGRDDSSSSDSEEEETKNEKKKKRRMTESERLEQAKTEEQRLRYIEERLMDPDRQPETVDDFDRAVLSNPDSSALWLKYMAFHIQNTEIEEARAVARRALKAISFREEQEKLNVWIALLNLENLYGTEESLNKVLSEALQYNEPYKIHLHMLSLYGRSNKLQDMEKLGNFMLKKYRDVENMWYEVGAAYFAVGKVESARVALQRALASLNKKQHVLLVSKFAQLENKHGNPERAQTLYESILGSFPKRVDIWSCYVDMLVKSNYIDLARQVLERATSQSLRPRKMKTLFKKFLTFEETHGTPETVEKVREAAVEYVQTVGGGNDD